MESISRLSELIEDWKFFAEREGMRSSLPLILSDIAMLPYRHLHFLVLAHPLQDPIAEWKPKIELIIRLFSQTDLNLVRHIDRPSEARLCARRLELGHVGLVAFYEGRLAGYTWGTMDLSTKIERVHPRLEAGDFLCTDSFTFPAYRGCGVQTALTLSRFQKFGEMGYSRAVCCIDVRNKPSLAVWQRKVNSSVIGTIDFMRIGSMYNIRYGNLWQTGRVSERVL